MTVYSLTHLTKVYDAKTVLDIDSLSIEKGNRYALLGPNGAGKTTLLKILAFLEHPSTGDILFLKQKVHFSESALQPLRKKVVMVNQRPVLFTTSVYKNIEFGLKIRKIHQKTRDMIIAEALDMVSMKHFIHAPAERLSGGETQRVALARALALSPEVILCDEPLSSIDLENQAAIINILKEINEQKHITILFTTHDRLQASSLAHRTIFLDKGKPVSSSCENIFSGLAKKTGGTGSSCRIQDSVTLSILSCQEGRIRLSIDPEKIRLLKPEETSPHQNRLTGRILQAAKEKNGIRLVVDSGICFNIILSPEAYKNHMPMIGENTTFYIPPESIQVL